jgi:hypothetical protein
MNLKVKIIAGFREDQKYTINGEQAHKAYRLFFNPDERTVFDNGLAIIGSSIRGIEPDYQATMGWNATHELDSDDWNEIRSKGVDKKLRDLLYLAKQVAQEEPKEKMGLPLSQIRPLLE